MAFVKSLLAPDLEVPELHALAEYERLGTIMLVCESWFSKAGLVRASKTEGLALRAEWPEARLSYWHVQGRHEVDFVIEAGRACVAVEVKRSSRWTPKDLSGLQAFLAQTPSCRAAVLAYGGRETVSLGDRLFAVPLASVVA